jgi:hypothetical protein
MGVSPLATNVASAPLILEGAHARLEPLKPEHASLLWEIAKDHLSDLFRWIPYKLESLSDFQAFNARVLDEQARGLSVPFATFQRSTGQVVGTTRYMNMDLGEQEGGNQFSWIAPLAALRSIPRPIPDVACIWGVEVRVELKTDAQPAIASGDPASRRERGGTLRKHILTWKAGSVTRFYFSILDTDWRRSSPTRIKIGAP